MTLSFHVAKCNLGKVRLEPMRSAVLFMAVRDLWGGPGRAGLCCAIYLACNLADRRGSFAVQ